MTSSAPGPHVRDRGEHHRSRGRPTRGPILTGPLGGVVLLLSFIVVFTLTGDDRRPSAEDGASGTTTIPTHSTAPTTMRSTTPPSSTSSRTPPPTTYEDMLPELANHPLLQDPGAGLPHGRCELPGWQSTPAAAEAFFTAARQCLDAAWGPFLQAHDLPFAPPTLHFPSGSSYQTPCGTVQVGLAAAAYYCKNHLYLPFAGLQTDRYGDRPGVYLALFAHEYGHHVQELVGIMDAAWERIYAAGPDSPAGLEMSRRKELQAQCFSGMFLGTRVNQGGTITHEVYDQAWHDQVNRGDDTSGTRNHGSNANFAAWWQTGAQNNHISACNTFAASSDQVA